MDQDHLLTTPYASDGAVIFLSLPELDLPQHLSLDGQEFIPKSELHVTLVSVKHIAAQIAERDGLAPEIAERNVHVIASEIVMAVAPSFVGYRPEFWLVEKPALERATVILMVSMQGLAEVYDQLAQKLGADIPSPPAHVTLFTLANGLPIGLRSEADISSYARPLRDKEVWDLREQVKIERLFGFEL